MKRHIEIALNEYGITEITGVVNNPEVMKYYHEIGNNWVNDDETPWCAAFANWCLKKAGLLHTNKLNARSLLELKSEVDSLDNAEIGDIIIFWRVRPDSIYGHVAFLIREDGDYVWVLGGNQTNRVCIQKYRSDQIIGIRRPVSATSELNII